VACSERRSSERARLIVVLAYAAAAGVRRDGLGCHVDRAATLGGRGHNRPLEFHRGSWATSALFARAQTDATADTRPNTAACSLHDTARADVWFFGLWVHAARHRTAFLPTRLQFFRVLGCVCRRFAINAVSSIDCFGSTWRTWPVCTSGQIVPCVDSIPL
jgi:hypothetical protein